MKKHIALAALLIAGSVHAEPPASVGATGEQLDKSLFGAYNTCDLERFGNLLDPVVEFYHDKGGLMIGRENVVSAVRNNICGKVRRELVPGSLKSYPMDNYGLVQLGEHRFCTVGATTCNGVARFFHLWQLKDGAWHVTRIVSYDHLPL